MHPYSQAAYILPLLERTDPGQIATQVRGAPPPPSPSRLDFVYHWSLPLPPPLPSSSSPPPPLPPPPDWTLSTTGAPPPSLVLVLVLVLLPLILLLLLLLLLSPPPPSPPFPPPPPLTCGGASMAALRRLILDINPVAHTGSGDPADAGAEHAGAQRRALILQPDPKREDDVDHGRHPRQGAGR